MTNKPPLSQRDKAVLDHIARYGISITEILNRLFFAGSRDAMKGVLKRLTEAGFLQSRPLFAKEVCYQLTTVGCRFAGLPEEWAEPLGPQALPTHLAVLLFCNPQNGPAHPCYTREEFSKDFPEFRESFDNYFLDSDGTEARLGYIKVDLGGDYQRLVRTCRNTLRKAIETPGLQTLVTDYLFSISIVTYDVGKAEVLRRHLLEKPLAVPTTVEVVPMLGKLIPGTEPSDE